MKREKAALLIITSDEVLVNTLGGKLQEWGVSVQHQQLAESATIPEDTIDVILVDVRRQAENALQRLGAILSELPFAETILINSSDNISASMEGMRAGASDELTVPFDMQRVKKAVHAACARSAKRRKKSKKRSLFVVFEEAMTAATFAQAGEFAAALDILNGSAPKKSPPQPAEKKKNEPKQ